MNNPKVAPESTTSSKAVSLMNFVLEILLQLQDTQQQTKYQSLCVGEVP